MATYQITTPDGGTYEVTAPEAATEDAVLRYAQAMAPRTKADSNLPDTLQLGLPGMSGTVDTKIPLPKSVGSFLVGAGKAATRIGQGVQQLMPGDNSALDQQVSNENSTYAPLAQQHPWATGLGEAMPAAAIPLGAAASIPATIGRAALATALPGALSYGSPQERATQAAMGGVSGALGAGVGYGMGRLVNPIRGANPIATDETRNLANQAGITLTPAQATGSSVLSSLDGTLATMPGSASTMAKIRQGQMEGFNKAASLIMGQPAESSISNDAASIAQQGIGGRIQAAAAPVQVKLGTEQVINDLANVESKYMRNLSSDQKPFVQNAINDILGAGDSIPGETYQAWRARLGARANGTSDSEFKGAIKGIQGALDSAFNASAGPDASAAMAAARGQYRNYKTLAPLLEKAAMSNSDIPPAQVMSRALATGNTSGQMQNLAQLGQAIGKDYPNSGTVPRMFWMEAMRNPMSIPTLGPMALTSWLAANAIHNPAGRAYLTNELVSPTIDKILMRSGGLLGLGAGTNAANVAGLLR